MMARASYLARRDGRYYIQIRCSAAFSRLAGRTMLRSSLRTADYRRARRRLAHCLGWILAMNDSPDYPALFRHNVHQLKSYLADTGSVDEDRLFARKSFEELLKNLNRRAKAAGYDPTVKEPAYNDLFQSFVAQNVSLEAGQRQRERFINYERGRADATTAMQMGLTAAPTATLAPPMPAPPQAAAVYPVETPAIVAPSGLAVEDRAEPETSPERSLAATPLSEALEAYLIAERRRRGHDGERGEVGLVMRFFIDEFGDVPTGTIARDNFERFDQMLPEVPLRKNIPAECCVSLSARYRYAETHGWDGLQRLTETRIKNGYHPALSRFFAWLIREGYYPGPKPTFTCTTGENLVALPRDAFDDDELKRIFSQPLFTGCGGHTRIWKPGPYFIQNHLYWAYLIGLLTGMRPGEIGQLRVSDLEVRDGHLLFDLRLFDPSQGRVARKDAKQLKTEGAARKLPVHPLIVDLGLLERAAELKEIDCDFLFPEWEPYFKPSGEPRWGQPVTKSWQYMKGKLGLSRENISVYSARHWMAQQLDELAVSQRTRQLMMGHSIRDDTPSGYGSKSQYASRDMALITGLRPPILAWMADTLLDARERAARSELTVLKPWLQRSRWSDFHRNRSKA